MSVSLEGILVPTVTAMTDKEELDEQAMRRIIRFQIEEGADILIPTASNGEFAHLTNDERRQVWEVFVDEARGRVPIVPCTTAVTTKDAISLSKRAESLGASAVLVAPPYYYYLTESELLSHYRAVAESVSIPIILYNEPSLYKVDLTPSMVKELSHIDNILYIKESSMDSRRIHEIIRLTDGKITVFAGACDLAFEGLMLGAKGWVTGFLNFYIRVPKEFYRMTVSGEYEKARTMYYQRILPLAAFVKASPQGVPVMKAALEMLGLPAGPARRPMIPMSITEKEALRALLIRLGLPAK